MKKRYLIVVLIIIALLTSVLIVIKGLRRDGQTPPVSQLKEASFYRRLENGAVQCQLCPNQCILGNRQRGLCKVRENINGKLYSLVYGKPVTINVDPIEKKPFYHFLPGAKAYSLATAGCNLNCRYCQNWDISQRKPEELNSQNLTPEQVVDQALKSDSQVIAFTYNEPTVWYEYMLDIAKLAKKKGLKTVMISSGYINQKPLKNLLPYLDAIKVDLKSFNSEVYQQLIRGNLEPVLETIKTIHKNHKWLELVHLTVPGYTDDLNEIKRMCQWIKDNVGIEVPIQFSRFYPMYKLLNLPSTPEETVKKARQVCQEVGLKYVYTGNIDDLDGSTTYCSDNHKPVIVRRGFLVQKNLVDKDGKVKDCPSIIPGVWQ